jgi:hypothetical protein
MREKSSVSDPVSIRLVDPYPDTESGSVPRRAKMAHKNIKKLDLKIILCFEVLDLLRAEGYVLYGGLGIGKLQFLVNIFF